MEIKRIAFSLSKCASPCSWAAVEKAALPLECWTIGMLRGKPPASRYDRDFFDFVRVLYKKKFTGVSGEYQIFLLLSRRLK